MNLWARVADAYSGGDRHPGWHSPTAFALACGRDQWQMAPHFAAIEAAVLSAITDGATLVVEVPVRHGKALAVETPIPTPRGWTPIGDLVEGDVVFDERGHPCGVTYAFDAYEADAYEVRFSDGTSIVADGDHQWLTYSRREAEALGDWRRYHGLPNRAWPEDWGIERDGAKFPTVRRTRDLVGERWRVPVAAPIECAHRDLPLDPYLLGLWLGDGSKTANVVTCHEDDAPHYVAELARRGHVAEPTCKGRSLKIDPTGQGNAPGKMGAALRALGVWGNKHVPAVYMRASAAQRLDLLRGLMDSDGGVERSTRNTGRVSFTNQNKALADAAAELFMSLGCKVTRDARPAKLNGRETGETAYRVSSSPTVCPFTLPRKVDAWADDSKGSLTRRTRMICDIVAVGRRRVRCIAVDSPSHLYLAGEAMVPTHNSLMVSQWLPAWYLGRNPDRRVIEVTHSAEFAAKWGRAARDLLVEHGADVFGVEVSPRSQAANRWDIEGHAGGLLALGVGGSPIGQGADLCVVDDPYGSFADAMSPLIRRKVQEWWAGTMTSRIEPGGAVIVLCSRWHEDDLPGWLQREGEGVRVLRLPAVADSPDDALGREVGEALWPDRWPLPELEKKHRQTAMVHGEAVWLAQYQQTPKKPEGGMFPGDRWAFLPGLPVEAEMSALWVRGWDLAATEDGGDWTVGALIGMLPDGFSAPLPLEGTRPRFVVADVVRGQWSADRVRAEMISAAQRDPVGTRVALPQDPGQAGKDQVQQLKRLLTGRDVIARPVQGAKELRAAGLSAMQREGLVALVEGTWNGPMVAELEGFPRGSHDDQVDALAEAYNVAVSLGTGGAAAPQRYRDNRRRGRR